MAHLVRMSLVPGVQSFPFVQSFSSAGITPHRSACLIVGSEGEKKSSVFIIRWPSSKEEISC